MKRILKWLAILLATLMALALAVPLFIPVKPLENTQPARLLADDDSQFINLGNPAVQLHYKADTPNADDELTFVLLHGSTLNLYSWQPVMSFFSERGRVIAYDQVPYGLSTTTVPEGVSADAHYSLPASVDRLINLVDALNAKRVVLVGNSFGGVLAAAALAAQPERFEGVIFVDAAVYVDASMPSWLMNSPQMANIGPYFARALGFNESFYRSMFAEPNNITDAMRVGAQRNIQADNWDTGLWQYLQNWRYDVNALKNGLAEIQLPALVLSGREDAIVPVSDSQRIAEVLPVAEYEVLPNCGHLPQLECPQAFQQAVQSWLEGTF